VRTGLNGLLLLASKLGTCPWCGIQGGITTLLSSLPPLRRQHVGRVTAVTYCNRGNQRRVMPDSSQLLFVQRLMQLLLMAWAPHSNQGRTHHSDRVVGINESINNFLSRRVFSCALTVLFGTLGHQQGSPVLCVVQLHLCRLIHR
jgi:hypothetical protein